MSDALAIPEFFCLPPWVGATPNGLVWVLSVLLAYGVGTFNSGYYLAKWKFGMDLRDHGSGNAGATNAGRILGTPWFLLTLFLDAFKGMLMAWVGSQWLPGPFSGWLLLAAVMGGHIWPCQLAFHGGKGVACFLGGACWIAPWLTLALPLLFLPIYSVTRSFSRSGLWAIALSPVVSRLLRPGWEEPLGLAACAALLWFAQFRQRSLSPHKTSVTMHEN